MILQDTRSVDKASDWLIENLGTVQYLKQLTPRFMFSHKLSIPSSNTLSNANAPITIVTANVEVRRNKALYTVLPILILARESSCNPSSPASERKMAAA